MKAIAKKNWITSIVYAMTSQKELMQKGLKKFVLSNSVLNRQRNLLPISLSFML